MVLYETLEGSRPSASESTTTILLLIDYNAFRRSFQLLLLPKGIFSLENVQINDKCDDTGQTQGFSGRLHAIVRNFVLDLVTDITDVTMDGVSLSFFFAL